MLGQQTAYCSLPTAYCSWCERGDSNPHTFRYQILSLARLPIPPLSQLKHSEIENSTAITRYRTESGSDWPGYAGVSPARGLAWCQPSSRDDCVPRPVATAPGSVTRPMTSGAGRLDN